MSLIKRNRNSFNAIPALFDDFPGRELFNWDNTNYSSKQTTIPMVNIKESTENFEVGVAVPGMDKKDFKIQLDNSLLTIFSQKENSEETQQNGYSRKEFSYQSFQRSIILPKGVVDQEGIKANYNNGLLHLTIPKKEEIKQKGPGLIEVG